MNSIDIIYGEFSLGQSPIYIICNPKVTLQVHYY